MLSNPKTTIAGYLILTSAVLTLVADFITGNFAGVSATMPKIMAALTGLGLIMAKDGAQ